MNADTKVSKLREYTYVRVHVEQDDTKRMKRQTHREKQRRARARETLWTLSLYFPCRSFPLSFASSFAALPSFLLFPPLSLFLFLPCSSPSTVLPVIPGANHAVVPHFHYRIPRAVVRRPRSFMPRATRGDMFCVRFIRERSHEGNCAADLQGTIFCLLSPTLSQGLISIPTQRSSFFSSSFSIEQKQRFFFFPVSRRGDKFFSWNFLFPLNLYWRANR